MARATSMMEINLMTAEGEYLVRRIVKALEETERDGRALFERRPNDQFLHKLRECMNELRGLCQ